MRETIKVLCKYYVLFAVFGWIYYCIEILFRGYSHWSMFLLAGLCCVLIGMLNEFTDKETSIWLQMLWSALLVTLFEFLFGVILNMGLKWHIWDYSDAPFNVMGQVCLPFTLIWYFLSLPAILLDDLMREKFFGEEGHQYNWKLQNKSYKKQSHSGTVENN